MRSKHILVPLDLVRGSASALVAARQLAMENPVRITLLHVVELNIFPPQLNVIDQLRAESQAALRKLAKLFFGSAQAAGVLVRFGRPAEEIIGLAKEIAADLIVLCGPKAGPMMRLLHPGTAQRVIRHACCPTLVLPTMRKAAAKEALRSRWNISEEPWFFRKNPEPAPLS